MSTFSILLKMNLQKNFRLQSAAAEKSPAARCSLFINGLISAVIPAAAAAAFYLAFAAMAQQGFAEILPILSYLVSSIATLIFTILKIHALLSDSNESEFLLALPVPSILHVAMIFLLLYLQNLFLTALIEIPAVLVYARAQTVTSSFWGYWTFGLFITCLPASGIACLIGVIAILCLVTNPNNNQIHSGLSLAFLLGFTILLCGIVCSLINQGAAGAENVASMITTMVQNYKLARFYQIGIFAQDGGWTFMFFFISIIWYAFFFLILGIGYPIIISSLRTPKSYTVYRWQPQKSTPLAKTLFHRELELYFRSKSYFKRSFYFLMLLVIISTCLVIESPEKIGAFFGMPQTAEAMSHIARCIPFLLCTFISLGNTTYCSLSMEGKRYWILASTPFNRNLVYAQKIKLNLLLTLPVSLVSSVLLIAAFRPGIAGSLLYILIPCAWCFVSSWWGMKADAHHPDFTLDEEELVMRRTVSYLSSYMLQIMFCLLLAVLVFLTYPQPA